jgi:uncharacterized membrane protein YvlD (DUF360 family)
MRTLLLRFFINAAAIGVTIAILNPHIQITGNSLPTLVVVAIVFGLVNALIRPVIALLTCPLVLLTLGLFIFVINGLMLYLAAFISGLITVISLVLERLLAVNEQRVVVKKVEVRTIVEQQRSEADRFWDQAVSGTSDFDLIDPETGKPRRP